MLTNPKGLHHHYSWPHLLCNTADYLQKNGVVTFNATLKNRAFIHEDMTTLPFRVGIGYDIHRFRDGGRLVLGGVEIPHDRGLEGHSDADCLIHALADAILGAMGLPDIGHFFPVNDPSCKDMDSREILRRSVAEAKSRGYKVGNVDVTIIAEEPKISPHIAAMKACLGEDLRIGETEIGLKATTNEGLGDLGRRAGIATHAICMLVRET